MISSSLYRRIKIASIKNRFMYILFDISILPQNDQLYLNTECPNRPKQYCLDN